MPTWLETLVLINSCGIPYILFQAGGYVQRLKVTEDRLDKLEAKETDIEVAKVSVRLDSLDRSIAELKDLLISNGHGKH